MGYILVVVGVLTAFLVWPVLHEVTPARLNAVIAGVLVFVTAASAAATALPMYLGLRHLKTMEF